MDIDDKTINRISNSLNAQSGLLRHKSVKSKDIRELNLSELLHQAQVLILMLQEKIKSQEEHLL